MKVNNNFPGHLGTRLGIYGLKMKIAKDRKVIPDPIDDRARPPVHQINCGMIGE